MINKFMTLALLANFLMGPEVFAKTNAVRWGKYEGRMNWHKASKLCKSKGLRLPTRVEIWAMGIDCSQNEDERKDFISEFWTSETRKTCGNSLGRHKDCAFVASCSQAFDDALKERKRLYAKKSGPHPGVRCVR